MPRKGCGSEECRSTEECNGGKVINGIGSVLSKVFAWSVNSGKTNPGLDKKKVAFEWGVDQEKAFDSLNRLITQADTLAYFRVDLKTTIIADASLVGLGAVLTQRHGETWRVVAYASRSLTDVETQRQKQRRKHLPWCGHVKGSICPFSAESLFWRQIIGPWSTSIPRNQDLEPS